MLEFVTREVLHPTGIIEAACLVSKPHDASASDDGVIKDGALLPLPTELVMGIAEASTRCETMEQAGSGVDCTVFGALVLGGTYDAVPVDAYQHGLHRRIEFGDYWHEAEVLGATPTAKLAQFCVWRERLMPRHTAIKLPGTEGQFIQKIGHGLPIAITEALANFKFHRANTVATVNKYTAAQEGRTVLSYAASQPDTRSVDVFCSLPG